MQPIPTQEQPLASVFRQIGGGMYTPVMEKFERGKTIFFSWRSCGKGLFFSEGGGEIISSL